MGAREAARVAVLLTLLTFVLAGKKVSVKEVVFDSAVSDIQWLGEDQRTVITQTTKGRLYRSTNGGETWNDITDFFKVDVPGSSPQPFIAESITKSPADPNTILVSGNKKTNFISSTRGSSWKKLRQRSQIHTVIFHKTRPTWLLLSTWTSTCNKKKETNAAPEPAEDGGGPCNHMLYLSKDLGKTFSLVQNYVVQFSWGDPAMNQQDRIYFTHFRKKTGDQPKLYIWSSDVDFAYMDAEGRNWGSPITMVALGNKFLVSHKFIFVAKVKDVAAQTVMLMVSADGGRTFNSAQLPTEIDEKSYTVLDTSEGLVMLHVNHGAKEARVGNVYISDDKGYRFTLSLPNNVRGTNGDCEFDKVLSLEGVYMANYKETKSSDTSGGVDDKTKEAAAESDALEEEAKAGTEVDKRRAPKSKAKEESVIRTVISFDKGGAWSYLKPPRVDSTGKQIECPVDKCWLHLHGITNFHNYAPFYSTENAIGIIMGTGNVGTSLRFEPDQTNTYLSRNGGLTWIEAHKGAFIYEYGDHGGLVVMADDVRKTKLVVFSWNEGQSWYDFELSSMPVEVDNIVTEPNATSTKFLLYGTRGDTGVMYHLDFESLGQPLCKGVWASDSVSSDYETWIPSDGKNTEKCLMGKQVTYTRRKQTSECFNGEKFERPVSRKNCECTQEDFECEVGFTRPVGSTECRFADDGSIKIPLSCARNDHFFANGYRKVVGDTCEGGWQPQQVSVACPAKPMSKGAWSVLGAMGMLAAVLLAVNMLSQNERVKSIFANYGFESFGDVRYANIGSKAPESALDSVGTRFDADFIEGDQDDFDAPQLMNYTNDRDRDRSDRDRDRDDAARRSALDTASEAVPRLAKPPGGRDDEGVDLL
ncbi:Vacuolar protein sorting/targeting protein 10 (Carboxypeptidase Y receptor) (CPY receptor) (Sortilin VPS10) (Vacuolar carboxypeptidase sorting receptor VPS10) [Durusdinium trenchii]|uniref:Vacuolar protein sorting/targeting protein 10 (Carboxypeptidase Y receptor) (CPY receptor) (Sortilin VPS10) (Vacuolar carboxypeptidase sorting receptor VPS10) n=1 Tax=Durusdinium trenchii TaxID=1381693 RepID=A0ABP0JIZ4_9DINO